MHLVLKILKSIIKLDAVRRGIFIFNILFPRPHAGHGPWPMREIDNHSIVVIEDIDCNKDMLAPSKPDAAAHQDSDSEIDATQVMRGRSTLSYLLNCMDGLWCGDERIL
ncbi:hypothetical protein VNO77_40651 [Canavalia gladiata]|uniref:Uncharacterized protein n=1 Tax=Canavalia gladiata TaxID=3824 RepID=A0AAN9JY50_CANGL